MRLIKNVRSGPNSHDRLSQIAGAVGAAAEGHVDARPGDRFIIIIEDDNDVGSILGVGYEDSAEAATTLIGVLMALLPDAEITFGGGDG